MTLLDLIIWLILIAFLVKGFMKGLIREVCTLLGLVAGGWAGFKYYLFLAGAFTPLIHLPRTVAVVLAFLLIFLVIGLLFYLLGYLLTVILKIMLLGGVNRVGGMLFGLLEGAFILSLVLYLGTTPPVPEKVKRYLRSSSTAKKFIESGREIIMGWDTYSKKKPSVNPAQ